MQSNENKKLKFMNKEVVKKLNLEGTQHTIIDDILTKVFDKNDRKETIECLRAD